MYVVALLNPPNFTPGAARRLAAVLGVSPFQAAERLQVPGRGPAVVAHFGDMRPAEQLLALLEGAGFASTILSPEPPDSAPIEVASLGLDDWVMTLETTDGQRRVIVCDDVAAIIWGSRVQADPDAHDARDVVWQTRPERQGFVWLYSVHGDVAHFEEGAMRGLQPGEFQRLAEALRRACSHAAYDDRLLARRTQVKMLGELTPADHLDKLIQLIAYRLLT